MIIEFISFTSWFFDMVSFLEYVYKKKTGCVILAWIITHYKNGSLFYEAFNNVIRNKHPYLNFPTDSFSLIRLIDKCDWWPMAMDTMDRLNIKGK